MLDIEACIATHLDSGVGSLQVIRQPHRPLALRPNGLGSGYLVGHFSDAFAAAGPCFARERWQNADLASVDWVATGAMTDRDPSPADRPALLQF